MRIRLNQFKPLKLDRYVLEEIVYPFFGGVVFFSFVFLMSQVLRLADFMIVHGISGAIVTKLSFLFVLSFLPISIPVSFLISVLVGFGRLSGDSELVAMKSNGVSLIRMTFPVLTFSAVTIALSLALNLNWVPWGERLVKKTLIDIGNTKVVSSIQGGTFTTGFFDLLVFAESVNSETNVMKKVFIFDERDPKNPLAVVAKQGRISPVKESSDLGASIVLQLEKGNIHQSSVNDDSYQKTDFGKYELYLEVLGGSGSAAIKPKMYSFHDLVQRIQAEKKIAKSTALRELLVEFWRRISIALSPIAFVFLGVGFGTVRTRSVRAGAALIAFVVIFIYYLLQLGATSLAQSGAAPAGLLMQAPNVIMLAIGIWVFRKASW